MRIAIVCFGYSISVGSLTSALPAMLADAGHVVDIYLDRISHDYCASDLSHPGIAVSILVPQENSSQRFIPSFLTSKLIGDRFLQYLPAQYRLMLCSPQLAALSISLQKSLGKTPPDVIIAYDTKSLATLLWNKNIPICYLNLELLSWDEKTWSFPHKFLLKTLERDLLKSVSRTYATSPLRGEIFARQNGYPKERVGVLPAVPQGYEQSRSNNFFREKFSLRPDVKIVLHVGHVAPWTLLHEIIPTVADWPENTVLVVHTWDKNMEMQDYPQHLMALARNLPVFFSFEPIAKKETCAAWASADVGLAFYEAIDDNFTEILFSSNKFGEYMKAGLPVICSAHDSLKEFVNEHVIGKAVMPSDCAAAVTAIFRGYEDFAAAVEKCHRHYFVLEPYVEKLFQDFADIVNEKKYC